MTTKEPSPFPTVQGRPVVHRRLSTSASVQQKQPAREMDATTTITHTQTGEQETIGSKANMNGGTKAKAPIPPDPSSKPSLATLKRQRRRDWQSEDTPKAGEKTQVPIRRANTDGGGQRRLTICSSSSSPRGEASPGVHGEWPPVGRAPGEWRVLCDGRPLSSAQYAAITAPLVQPNWQQDNNSGKPAAASGVVTSAALPAAAGGRSRVATMMAGALSKPLRRMRPSKKFVPVPPNHDSSSTSSNANGGQDCTSTLQEETGTADVRRCSADGGSSLGSQKSRLPSEEGENSDDTLPPCTATRVVKSGMVKMAVHRLGRTQWKLRNIELCWDSYTDTRDKLRLTVFPVKGGETHKRRHIHLNSKEAVQTVSSKFPGRHVILVSSEEDYYLSIETEPALVDWVATLKSTISRAQDEPKSIFHVTSLCAQDDMIPAGNVLISFKEGSLLVQKPVSEELIYMTSVTSVAAFGANWPLLTWWFEVFTHRRRSSSNPSNQRFSFSTSSVRDIMDEMVAQMERAHGTMAQVVHDTNVTYKVSLHDGTHFSYDSVSPSSAPTYAYSALEPENNNLLAPSQSPQLTQPPKALICQLRERQSKAGLARSAMKRSGSESELSQKTTSPAPRQALMPNVTATSVSASVSLAAAAAAAAPPKPPRSHDNRKTGPASPPKTAPTPPPTSSSPTPTPRSRPEKPRRSSTSVAASYLSQQQRESVPNGSTATGHPESKVKKPTPAPRVKPKPTPPDPPRKALLPSGCRHPAATAATAAASVGSLEKASAESANAASLALALAPPSHVDLQAEQSSSSDFAYDYMIVDKDGDAGMVPADVSDKQLSDSKASSMSMTSRGSRRSSDIFQTSDDSVSCSESDDATHRTISRLVAGLDESSDSDDALQTCEISTASLKRIVGSFDPDSDNEIPGVQWPQQRLPPDGQEEDKDTPRVELGKQPGKMACTSMAISTGHQADQANLKHLDGEEVEVDHLYQNFQSGRLPQAESDDEN